MIQETSGVTIAPPRHLPSPLIAARAAAMHHLNCLDLNLTARRALFGILTFVSIKSLSKEIFPRRDTLRQEALLGSEGSLYRGLATLESKGYITRHQKRQTRTGKFHISPIFLTEKAIALLGLKELIHKYRSIKMEDGHIKERTTKPQSYQNTSSKADSVGPIDKKTHLPTEVMPLLQLDVKKSAICMLMKQAKTNGKRLSDLITVVWHNIYGLRDREVVAYLLSLMPQNLDFEFKARQIKQETDSRAQNDKWQETLNNLDSRLDGSLVYNAKNEFLGFFEYIGPKSGAVIRIESVRSMNGRQVTNHSQPTSQS